MRIENGSVVFENQDMAFVRKFGLSQAADMVLDYYSSNLTPFVYDISQLAALLDVSVKELRAVLDDIPSFYRGIKLPKRTGGFREINEPLPPLIDIQRHILYRILCCLPCSEFARAYYPGALLVHNAAPHTRKRYLLKMDITDFFGSVRFDAVMSAVFNSFRYPKQIGAMLTSLCCLEDVLPQGAPTSPALSNLVMQRFDTEFGKWCREHRLDYTRYCDDISVSGNDKLYPAYCKAKELLGDMGFEVNEKKTRFITNASRMTVTGITVNDKPCVPSDYKRKLRQELYYVGRYGLKSAAEYMKLSDPEKYYRSLMGRLNFVLCVEPKNTYFDSAKQKLREQRNGAP